MRRRVAFISHSLRLYGASRSLLALLEGFRAADVETCTILPGAGLMWQALEARGFACATVPFPCWVTDQLEQPDRRAFRAAQARSVTEIVALLERVRPDLVWSNTVTAVGALAAAALGLPHVWHLREVNGDGFPFRFIEGSDSAAALMRAAGARIAVSRAVKNACEQLGSGPCEVIYSGVGAMEVLAARPAPRPRQGRMRMLLPGRLREEKGQLTAVEATRLLRAAGHDVELRIVGDGEVRPCEDAIARLRLGDVVTLAGFVEDMDAEYRQADLVLTCSLTEAMGRTTVEAMSYGLPVVGCDRMGTAELIEHGVTGMLCDGSAVGLARTVERLIEQPDVARRIGELARRVARRRFSNERCTRAALDVLRRICPPPDNRSAQPDATARTATSERYRA